MERVTIPSELLFRFSAEGSSFKVTGAHYKTLEFIRDGAEEFGHKESDALDISLADPEALGSALGSVNTALLVELGQLRAELQAANAAAGGLQQQLDETVRREQALIAAAELGEQQRLIDAETIEAQRARIAELEAAISPAQ